MIREATSAQITVTPLRRNISIVEGAGGNIAVLDGKDGKLLVDAGFSVSRKRLSEALASLGPQPITHLINTHWHIDHTDGNAWINAAGAEIIAHHNTLKHLSVDTPVEGWQFTFPAVPMAARPSIVFDSHLEIRLNDAQLDLNYYQPAHTDSDISVRFAEADVIHVGDTWWNGFYPFIDYSTGGSIDGKILATKNNIAAVTQNTIIVPGHGPVSNRAKLIEYFEMLSTIRENVARLKKDGRTLEDTVMAKPTLAFDPVWGNFLITPAKFTGLVYRGV
ncbi:MBL fold metallo-hydrolase [Terriglobus roseus]|nr:MBL fold metallo-hydrolase [Terriglobus roseus]